MTEKMLAPERAVNERDDWVAQLDRLVADAAVWSEEQEWLVEREGEHLRFVGGLRQATGKRIPT